MQTINMSECVWQELNEFCQMFTAHKTILQWMSGSKYGTDFYVLWMLRRKTKKYASLLYFMNCFYWYCENVGRSASYVVWMVRLCHPSVTIHTTRKLALKKFNILLKDLYMPSVHVMPPFHQGLFLSNRPDMYQIIPDDLFFWSARLSFW